MAKKHSSSAPSASTTPGTSAAPAGSLLQQLRDRQAQLPEAQAAVVRSILNDPQAAVAATVEVIAQNAGVSMPTIVRTCRSFGYASVREFMVALAQDLAVSGTFLHRSVLKDDSAEDVAAKIVHAATSSLTHLGRSLDMHVIDEVASHLAEAKRIDCYSVGIGSTFIATELQIRLMRLGRNSNATYDAHQQLISASNLGKGDVAFAVSHVGRMPYMLESVRFARSQGATVIALTQPQTPLAQLADLVLEIAVPQDAVMRVGTETYLSHLVVLEVLMVRLAQKLGPDVARKLQSFRQTLHKHGFDSAEFEGSQQSYSHP